MIAKSAAKQIETTWQAASVNKVYLRVAAPDGTGQPTGVSGEGNWIKQADLSSITYSVDDITDPDDVTAIASAVSVTVSSAISDTPASSPAVWPVDGVGYNMTHSLPTTAFPTRGNRYRVVYSLTLSGGNVSQIVMIGDAV